MVTTLTAQMSDLLAPISKSTTRTQSTCTNGSVRGTLDRKSGCWRREWDSNPRYGFPHTRFPSVRLKPLGHLSGFPLLKGQDAFCKGARAGDRKFPQLLEYKRLFRLIVDTAKAARLNRSAARATIYRGHEITEGCMRISRA